MWQFFLIVKTIITLLFTSSSFVFSGATSDTCRGMRALSRAELKRAQRKVLSEKEIWKIMRHISSK